MDLIHPNFIQIISNSLDYIINVIFWHYKLAIRLLLVDKLP